MKIDSEDIFIKLPFKLGKYACGELVSLEDILNYADELYSDNDRLNERVEDLEEDIQDNYKPVSKKEQYEG
jgi:hypothetical protein